MTDIPTKMLRQSHINHLLTLRYFVINTLMITILTGCSSLGTYGTKGQSKEDFIRYVEEVFRLQNKMTSEMMALSDDDATTPCNPSLSHAEQQMQTVCADLNEYVSRDIDGLSTGLLLRRRVEKSALSCEKAALAIDVLLKKYSASAH
jgi:hypothetical protein